MLVWLAACGSQSKYINPTSDLGNIRTVAVLPFENMVSDKMAAEKVQRIFLTELLATNVFDVVEPGQVLKFIRNEHLEPGAPNAEELKRAGQLLKADAIFTGSVIEYEEGRGTGGAPQVTLQMKLIETSRGVTIWSVTRTRGGTTASARLFGIGGKSATEVVTDIVQEEMRTFGP